MGITTADSTSHLISVRDALQSLLEYFHPLNSVEAPLSEADGRVLAQNVTSTLDLPAFDYSSMDGFAVRSGDVRAAQPSEPVQLRVIGDIPAGIVPVHTIGARQTARIMTGAQIPEGADAVVPVEDTDAGVRQGGQPLPQAIRVYKPVNAGDYIRPQGQDARSGDVVLKSGVVLRPQEIGFLGMLGVSSVPVTRRPRVAVFSTGDELISVEETLAPGKIHDANTYTLTALVKAYGGEAISLGVVPDKATAVKDILDLAISMRVDMIISSAGVSVGAFDYVRQVIEEHGRLQFWRVNMRPGKPFAFGAYQAVPFFGLPGNPVSAFVGFEVFVRPALNKMAGLINLDRPYEHVVLIEPIESDGRESYLRAKVTRQDGQLVARLTGHQGSGNLRSLVQGNALLVIPSGVKSLPAGSRINAWILGVV